MKKGKGKNTGLLPNSLKIISSCIKTVSTNASTVVRSAGATVAASIAASGDDQRDQVIWAGFDKLQISPASFRHVLLLGYQNGFQVIDVEDASDFTELVSKRDGPTTFLQLLHIPAKSEGNEKFLQLHPLLVVVAGDEPTRSTLGQSQSQSQTYAGLDSPTVVRFYSLQSNCYVKVLRFRSTVFMVRCSPLIVAVCLEKEIHCIDAVTLETKFTVPTYPVPQSGYGPLAVGPRWLAYASNKLLVSKTGHLSPKNLTPGISPSTSPSNGSLMARYAMESSKQLAAGIITLGDKGYKTFSKHYPNMLQEVRSFSSEVDNAGMVIVKDIVTEAVISQFRAHSSPLSALCFDPSGTLLVTASINGNNVNIFRIMPCTRNHSTNQIHDYNSSHLLLYKLHRGITSAVIQDISFSSCCKWISIISSKGTCHVFVISPFGGETGYRAKRAQNQTINPVQSLPWWSTPPPLTLSVVGRIKNNNNSGFLNSVTNATSFVGKTNIPSGAVASVFHNSTTYRNNNLSKKNNSLEYMLVYTPSGYVIQYELILNGIQTGQDDELGVVFESRKCWQVCRQLDFPEREECSVVGQTLVNGVLVKGNKRAHLFLSNAELQLNSGRLPVWQDTKVHFYAMKSVNIERLAGGETYIENIPCYEIDIRRKDLLPVFDHFNSIKSGWVDREYSLRKYQGSNDESVIYLSKPASISSTESSDGGSSRRTENLLDIDPINYEKSNMPITHTITSQTGHKNPLTTDHFDMKERASPFVGSNKPVDFVGCFQEGYCKVVEPDSVNDYGENDDSLCGWKFGG